MGDPNGQADLPISQWARRQLDDYDRRQPGTLFSEGVVLTVEQGYRLQDEVSKLRVQRGERVVGYKVGCTSKTIRSQLGIDQSINGRLYHNEQHEDGCALSRSSFAQLAIEGELAVRLSRAPTASDFAQPGFPDCIDRVFPVIELHHHVIRGAKPSAGELIASNAIHAGVVAGAGVSMAELPQNPASTMLDLAIRRDEQRLDGCSGTVLLETICSSLKWLTTALEARWQRLYPGQIVLTGSVPGLIAVSENCEILVETKRFGSVRAKFLT
ncbi:2-keto-4-pentenoate hydratase [Stieleria bergensis]|uniref:2-keto-4-pentenoate hydratase n=1 Tax=Stieleria bergensis TaxID=2528025 RepID=A0A517SUE0_9BACT|nr:2-keto-4-pentenoate hydratase [Planctomycetes bacterium SV_7m_r]